MQILVTGGAGFIGSHLVDALLQLGHNVVVVDDFSHGRESNLAEAKAYAAQNALTLKLVRASLADPSMWSSLGACEAVFHTASHTSVVGSVKNPEQDFQANIDPIPFILKYVRSKKSKYLLTASSGGTVYGDAPYFPTDERALIQPKSPHGVTKAFFELYLQAWTSSLKATQELSDDLKNDNYFSWASLRLGNTYGPRQQPHSDHSVVPLFVEDFLNGRNSIIFGDGSKTRDYIYVGDVVACFLRAFEEMQKLPLDDVFNVATGRETKDLDVFNAVLEALKEQYPNQKFNAKPQFQARRPGEVTRSLLDINKAAAQLAWEPQVPFKEGVRLTVEAFAKNQGQA
jgi:UDP-glucose 4-epimerase